MCLDKNQNELKVGDEIVGIYTQRKPHGWSSKRTYRGAPALERGVIEKVYTTQVDVRWVNVDDSTRANGDRIFRLKDLK